MTVPQKIEAKVVGRTEVINIITGLISRYDVRPDELFDAEELAGHAPEKTYYRN